VKISLPTISAVSSISEKIIEIEDGSDGRTYFNYEISVDADTVMLLGNDVSIISIVLVESLGSSPTSDFRKLARGDLSPAGPENIRNLYSVDESSSGDLSAMQFSPSLTVADRKKILFSKNKAIARSIIKNENQQKAHISKNSQKRRNKKIGEASISVNSSINSDVKKEIARQKLKNSIVSSTGDTISKNSSANNVFFDGGFKISQINISNIPSFTSKNLSEIPIIDSLFIQKRSQSILSNIGNTEYVRDSSGNVTISNNSKNISVSTSQDALQGVLERSGNGTIEKSPVEQTFSSACKSAIIKYGMSPTKIISKDISEIINSAYDNFQGTLTKKRS